MGIRELKIITVALGLGFLAILSAFIFLSVGNSVVDQNSGERRGGICTDTPQFSEYPAEVPSNIMSSTTVDFKSDERALTFKTSITEWFERGAQSGGYYAVAEWGCGTGCQDHAIIDIRNGKITTYGLPSTHGVGYRINSNLLVINPPWNVESDLFRVATTSTEFYEVQDGAVRLICKKLYSPNSPATDL